MGSSIDTREFKGQLTGLFHIQRRIYWIDFLFHLTLGYGAFFLSQWIERASGIQNPFFWLLFLISCFSIYRAVIFIHEITHSRKQLTTFSTAWNLLCGIPLAAPSFLYYQSHLAHHRVSLYGTPRDGEYLPFASLSPWELVKYVVISFFAQFLLILRFAVLTPLGVFIPAIRKWIIAHGSSLVIDPDFIGVKPSSSEARDWAWQEPLTSVFWIAVLGGVAMGLVPLNSLLWLFAMMGVVHIVNALRTLAAHRFSNESGMAMTAEQQFLDSVNLTGKGWRAWLNILTAPVGLRYHALHHLFPGLPYHSLPKAHDRISQVIPQESNYFLASEPTLLSALCALWKSTARQKGPHQKRHEPKSQLELSLSPNSPLESN